MKHLTMLPALAVLLGVAGCNSTPPEAPKMKMAMGIPAGSMEFEPVSTKQLSLKLLSKPEVFAGEKAILIFAVSNDGNRRVELKEWYANEPDNLIVYVQPWLTNMTEPDPNNWTELSFDMKKPVFHYPITLLPGNKIMVAKELNFIENIHVSPGKMRRFFLKASLNLKSAKLQSSIVKLQVLNKPETGEK